MEVSTRAHEFAEIILQKLLKTKHIEQRKICQWIFSFDDLLCLVEKSYQAGIDSVVKIKLAQ